MTKSSKQLLVVVCLLGAVLGWAYWPTFLDVVERWWTNPLYSHGYLVPVFAGFLLWRRRAMLTVEPFAPCWSGIPVILLGAATHLFGAYFYFDWISAAAILPILAGICLAVGGANLLRWAWPAVAFLAFMLPLPYAVETSLAYPLQRLATVASTYVLQTLGFAAVSEGNVIILENARLGIVEACNGLGMLVTFFAMATAVAMVIRGRPVDKLILVLSGVPIALIANTLRISLTGVLAETVSTEIADAIFHDAAGWFMMPVALGLLFVEKLVLDKLLVETPEQEEAFRFDKVDPAKQTCLV